MGKKEQISIGLTFYLKFILPAILALMILFLSFMMLIENHILESIFTGAFLIIPGILFLIFRGIYKVHLDEESFYISNFSKSIKVPFDDVDNIEESWFMNLHPIEIRFKQPTVFGKRIIFIPYSDISILSMFKTHKTTLRLQNLINAKQGDIEK